MTKTLERQTGGPVVHTSACATILVHAEPDAGSTHRVEAAAHLARDLGARLIGLGAETFDPGPYSGPFLGYNGAEWAALVQEQIDKNLVAAETAFRRDAAGVEVAWRAVRDYPHRALARAAAAADLVVVAPRGKRGAQQAADPADVVMTAGRPVLVVPEGRPRLVGKTVVVAWKNTRECRRALTDALPFLQRAEDVIVLAVVKAGETDLAELETADVVTNLKRHAVAARPLLSVTDTDAVEEEIERVAASQGADLIVAGAFGHSRVREWAFGGATASFLHRPRYFTLLSH